MATRKTTTRKTTTEASPLTKEEKAEHAKARTGSVISREQKVGYKVWTQKNGRKSLDNADQVATLLRKLTLEQTYGVAAKVCAVSQKSLKERYAKLNPGMQRMNLGNKIRGNSDQNLTELRKVAK